MEWGAESEALGLVRLGGRVVSGEVGRARARARVTWRCDTGLMGMPSIEGLDSTRTSKACHKGASDV